MRHWVATEATSSLSQMSPGNQPGLQKGGVAAGEVPLHALLVIEVHRMDGPWLAGSHGSHDLPLYDVVVIAQIARVHGLTSLP